MKYFFLPILICLCTQVFAQKYNAHVFISPNVSVSYDTLIFRTGKTFGSPSYEGQSQEFNTALKDSIKRIIYVSPVSTYENFAASFQDSVMLASISYLTKKAGNDTIRLMETSHLFHWNGFSCLGFSTFVSADTASGYANLFQCLKTFKGGLCQITYIASEKQPTSLKTDSVLLVQLLSGIKDHTPDDYKKEDEWIKRRTKVWVNRMSKPLTETQKRWGISYYGELYVKPAKNRKIKEIHVRDGHGYRLYRQKSGNSPVLIEISEKKHGKCQGAGKVILYDSLGKEVEVPFKFTYYSE